MENSKDQQADHEKMKERKKKRRGTVKVVQVAASFLREHHDHATQLPSATTSSVHPHIPELDPGFDTSVRVHLCLAGRKTKGPCCCPSLPNLPCLLHSILSLIIACPYFTTSSSFDIPCFLQSGMDHSLYLPKFPLCQLALVLALMGMR